MVVIMLVIVVAVFVIVAVVTTLDKDLFHQFVDLHYDSSRSAKQAGLSREKKHKSSETPYEREGGIIWQASLAVIFV